MKRAKQVLLILGVAAAVLILGIAVLAYLFQYTGSNTTSYYGRIDNDLVEEITPHGGMNYRYHMPVYLEDGLFSNPPPAQPAIIPWSTMNLPFTTLSCKE